LIALEFFSFPYVVSSNLHGEDVGWYDVEKEKES
jgi:hypothetical protein